MSAAPKQPTLQAAIVAAWKPDLEKALSFYQQTNKRLHSDCCRYVEALTLIAKAGGPAAVIAKKALKGDGR